MAAMLRPGMSIVITVASPPPPEPLKTSVSPGCGTAAGLQLDPTLHAPLVAPVQVRVMATAGAATSVRTTSDSARGTRRSRRVAMRRTSARDRPGLEGVPCHDSDSPGRRGHACATPASQMADVREQTADVVIIGADLAGLVAGAILTRRGRRVVVLEHADSVGGRCGAVA